MPPKVAYAWFEYLNVVPFSKTIELGEIVDSIFLGKLSFDQWWLFPSLKIPDWWESSCRIVIFLISEVSFFPLNHGK